MNHFGKKNWSKRSFKALRVKAKGLQKALLMNQMSVDDLSKGEIVIRSEYSSLNYKDALAVTG